MAQNRRLRNTDYCEIQSDVDADVEAMDDIVRELTDGKVRLSKTYRKEVLPFLLVQFGLDCVRDSLMEGVRNYHGNIALAVEKLGGICAYRQRPDLNRRNRALSKIAEKLDDFDWEEGKCLAYCAWTLAGEDGLKILERIARKPGSDSWEEEKADILDAIRGCMDV